jgi:hypothetical protein
MSATGKSAHGLSWKALLLPWQALQHVIGHSLRTRFERLLHTLATSVLRFAQLHRSRQRILHCRQVMQMACGQMPGLDRPQCRFLPAATV